MPHINNTVIGFPTFQVTPLYYERFKVIYNHTKALCCQNYVNVVDDIDSLET